MMQHGWLGLMLLAAVLILAGCGQSNQDLEQFVADAKARPAAPIEPIPEIEPYRPFTYRPGDRRAPFTPTIEDNEPAPAATGPAPNRNREPDPLEAFELDSLRMVGSISHGGVTYALIKAPDNIIYRAARGEHLGQNYGRIDSVSEQGVTLTEIVPDGRGGYIKRPAAIAP